jgi:hypothetical protein
MAEQQAHFEGWAVVELFGHGKATGFVTTEYYGAACLFRVDTPEREEREYILERPEYGRSAEDNRFSERLLPVGTKVKRPGTPARTRLVGPSSIFALNPCTEEAARRVIERDEARPLILVELPKNIKPETLLAGDPEGDDGEEEQEDCEREEETIG